MNKEKILESSRRENKNRDLAEMEVTAQAGNSAGRVGAAVCVVLTLIFRIFTKTYFLSPWIVYFSMLHTPFLWLRELDLNQYLPVQSRTCCLYTIPPNAALIGGQQDSRRYYEDNLHSVNRD